MFAVGTAAAAAGVIMLIVGRDDDEEVAVAPSAGPGFAGLSVSGRF
jgi:hypothetical protein